MDRTKVIFYDFFPKYAGHCKSSVTRADLLPLRIEDVCSSPTWYDPEALTLLNRTLPSRNLLYRKELNRTLPNQETDKTESGKPHSAQPESDKPNLGIC